MRGARVAVPEDLKGLSLDKISWCIKQANLGREDRKIAKLRLIEQLNFADIGAIVHADRTTVGKRFKAALPLIVEQKYRNPSIIFA